MSKKVVLVTGASRGFGKGTALELAKKGYVVYGAARRVEKMDDIVAAGGYALYMDVTDEKSVNDGVAQIIAEQGKIDILYANAGYGVYGTIFDSSVEAVKAMYDVNIHGTHRTISAVIPHMIKQNNGRIVITESMVSNISSAYTGWYSSTKHALKAMSNALNAELKDLDIDVVSIRPGAVKTGFDDVALDPANFPEPTKEFTNDQKGFAMYMTDMYKTCVDETSTVKCMVDAAESKNPKRVYNTTQDAKVFPKMQSVIGSTAIGNMMVGLYQSRYQKFEKTGK